MSKFPNPCSAPWRRGRGAARETRPQIKAQAEVEAAALLRQARKRSCKARPGSNCAHANDHGSRREQNTMTIIMMPSEFVEMARALGSGWRR